MRVNTSQVFWFVILYFCHTKIYDWWLPIHCMQPTHCTVYEFFYFKIETKNGADSYMPCKAMAHSTKSNLLENSAASQRQHDLDELFRSKMNSMLHAPLQKKIDQRKFIELKRCTDLIHLSIGSHRSWLGSMHFPKALRDVSLLLALSAVNHPAYTIQIR